MEGKPGPRVDFWFGPGSRYSYLAATQLDRISAKTGAVFRWRAMLSADLVDRTGGSPFIEPRGQYAPAYRHEDVTRWARHYSVQYVSVEGAAEEWRRLALACHAAEAMGAGEVFARRLLARVHAQGELPDDGGLAGMAAGIGLEGEALVSLTDAAETARTYQVALDEAVAAGVFGVPTFVTEAGERIWGQDRLPLLVDILAG